MSSPLGRIRLYSLILLSFFVIPALLAPWIAPHDIGQMDLIRQLETPSADHWMGLDENGSDILSRLLAGARISLYVGFWVIGISTVIGVSLGLLSGYFGGWLDIVLMRIVDVLLAFPGLLFLAIKILIGKPTI